MLVWSVKNMTSLKMGRMVSFELSGKGVRRDGPVDTESPSTGGRKTVLESVDLYE
jgi:hypothetical protein